MSSYAFLQRPIAHTRLSPRAPAPLPRTPGVLLQRKCSCGGSNGHDECEDCKKKLQRSATGANPTTVPKIVHEVLRSPGKPLDAPTRSFFERRFQHDFSRVRVHADPQSYESARAVNAVAYTVGHNMVFGSGQFIPETKSGRELLAHELTHVVQQSSLSGASSGEELSIDPSVAGEAEAQRNAAELSQHGFHLGSGVRFSADQLQALSLQRGADRCSGSNATCASAETCAEPDPGHPGSAASSGSWMLSVHIDTERDDWESALRNQEFGHTYVDFFEGNGRRYTYGFYPAAAVPNETHPAVAGCVHHPDTTHAACTDDSLQYTLSEGQYRAALSTAQKICTSGHMYEATYTCSTFASEVVAAAGQSMPAMRSAPATVYYTRVPASDNPNTLLDNVQQERAKDVNQRRPFWNNPCINRCEAEFNRCISTSRTGGMECIAARSNCARRCPKP